MTKSASKPANKPKRLRLAPEQRKELILDQAAAFIREYGIANLNMDRLARESDASKPLIYAYFGNRMGLLEALLLREVRKRRKSDLEAVKGAETIDELIRATSHSLLAHIQESGTILQQLLMEPEIAASLQEIRAENTESYVSYMARRAMDHYGIDPQHAPAIVEIVMGMGTAAGVRFERENADLQEIEDILVDLTKGALEAAAKKYPKS